jgi:hypothetical protein
MIRNSIRTAAIGLLLSATTLSTTACRDRAPQSALLDRSSGASDGVWQGTDQRSTWRAVLDGPRIAQLDEAAQFGDSTRASRRFRFDSTGTLTHAREERVVLLYGNAATPDTIRSFIELEWNTDSLVRAAKRVNGADRLLQPYEVDNLRAHADDLFRTARATTSTRRRER